MIFYAVAAQDRVIARVCMTRKRADEWCRVLNAELVTLRRRYSDWLRDNPQPKLIRRAALIPNAEYTAHQDALLAWRKLHAAFVIEIHCTISFLPTDNLDYDLNGTAPHYMVVEVEEG